MSVWVDQAEEENKEKIAKTAKKEVKEESKTTKTPKGQKKDTSVELPSAFDPIFCEEGWYSWWEEKKFFHADAKKVLSGEKKPFTMMIPPPNVTGTLHLGHGLMLAIEDMIA